MSLHIKTEYDDDIAKLVIMPGDPVRVKFIAENYLDDYKLVNNVRLNLAYTGYYKGVKVTVMSSGMGCPSMAIYAKELFDYYNVEKIDRIEYSIFDLANNYINTSEFTPSWRNGTDDQNIVYYKTTLPVEFTSGITYTIKMNLYAGNILVGQIDTTYIQE